MSNDLEDIADEIGEITTPRDDERDKKEKEEDIETFDVEEYRRDLDEYDGGWDSSH